MNADVRDSNIDHINRSRMTAGKNSSVLFPNEGRVDSQVWLVRSVSFSTTEYTAPSVRMYATTPPGSSLLASSYIALLAASNPMVGVWPRFFAVEVGSIETKRCATPPTRKPVVTLVYNVAPSTVRLQEGVSTCPTDRQAPS